MKLFSQSPIEWQARLWEKTKELHGRRQQEEEEEEGKVKEYREIGTHLKGFLEEDVRKALRLVSSFIRASEEVIEDEMDAVRSLDLLYRRVQVASTWKSSLRDSISKANHTQTIFQLFQETHGGEGQIGGEDQAARGLGSEEKIRLRAAWARARPGLERGLGSRAAWARAGPDLLLRSDRRRRSGRARLGLARGLIFSSDQIFSSDLIFSDLRGRPR
ncbi:hypothetical protein SO802_011696 [Lithocarpus litseifolius]|uniref:Uncharacterized protein n=1 Tax=Lithocarpus litseifolius TaxID=425828 RepID=A0AAW2D4V2_9ROSI